MNQLNTALAVSLGFSPKKFERITGGSITIGFCSGIYTSATEMIRVSNLYIYRKSWNQVCETDDSDEGIDLERMPTLSAEQSDSLEQVILNIPASHLSFNSSYASQVIPILERNAYQFCGHDRDQLPIYANSTGRLIAFHLPPVDTPVQSNATTLRSDS